MEKRTAPAVRFSGKRDSFFMKRWTFAEMHKKRCVFGSKVRFADFGWIVDCL